MYIFQSTPTIDTSAYAANDAVTVKNSFNVNSEHGFLDQIKIFDKGNIKAELYLYLFKNDFTGQARNAAFSIADADIPDLIAEVRFSTWVTPIGSAAAFSVQKNLGIPFYIDKSSSQVYTVYYQLATTGTPTYVSSSDLIIEFSFLKSGDL